MYLTRRTIPTWIPTIVQNFIYVENCSIAHLAYETALIPKPSQDPYPDISGQSFNISDPGPIPTYGDTYNAMMTLDTGVSFTLLSSTSMLLISHIVEMIYLSRYFLVSSKWRLIRTIGYILPNISGDLTSLQPSLWNLTQSHLIFDDCRARLPREQGGLGYKGVYTTLQGVCITVGVYLEVER